MTVPAGSRILKWIGLRQTKEKNPNDSWYDLKNTKYSKYELMKKKTYPSSSKQKNTNLAQVWLKNFASIFDNTFLLNNGINRLKILSSP